MRLVAVESREEYTGTYVAVMLVRYILKMRGGVSTSIIAGSYRLQDARPPPQGASRYPATWDTDSLVRKRRGIRCSGAYPNKGSGFSS